MPSPTIAIVGGGFSGTMLSLCLQSFSPAGTRVCLIERSGRFANGTAYGSANPNHLLNVPAGRMSAFPDLPLDFLRWLQRQPASRLDGIQPTESVFVPRRLYGCYLRHLLDRGLGDANSARLELVHGKVVAVEDGADGVTLRMASGTPLSADLAVLAMGNLPAEPCHPDMAALSGAGIWHADPWAPAAFADLGADASVLLVGAGLTAVDAVITLLDSGHTGPIHALSRHGLLPRRHVVRHGQTACLPSPLPSRLRSLTRCVRGEIARALDAGHDWQTVIDALRPFTQDLWRGLSETERARFRRHLCTWWDVHRHRMAPRIADRIEAARASGQLRVHAGRILAFDVESGRARVVFRQRMSGDPETLRAARVVNCSGPCADVTRSTDPLLQALLYAGAARPDPLRLGLDVTADGAVLGRTGIASRRLFALGPLTRGTAWEITAVPDIRLQCRDMARMLGGLLAADGPGASGISRRPRGEKFAAVNR